MTASAQHRSWRPSRPLDVHATLGSLRRGSGDPSYQVSPDGAVWRASQTPDGPGTLMVGLRRTDRVVEAQGWGAGAGWLLDRLPALLGEEDDPAGFDPDHPVLAAAAARYPGWRVPCTGLVLDTMVPTILEQKVTGAEARRSWRELLRRFGEPAPGPGGAAPAGLRVPPDARTWTQIPSWDWHRAGVGPQRSATVVRTARAAGRLQETVGLPGHEVDRRLRSLPGIGAWTAAEVRQRVHGDADAVSVGDYHLPTLVGMALAGRPVDDDGMLELLAPYAGHRYRAVRLVELTGVRVPRRAPRAAIRDYRRM